MSTARQIICGYEIFAMIRKGQVKRIPVNDMGANLSVPAAAQQPPSGNCHSGRFGMDDDAACPLDLRADLLLQLTSRIVRDFDRELWWHVAMERDIEPARRLADTDIVRIV